MSEPPGKYKRGAITASIYCSMLFWTVIYCFAMLVPYLFALIFRRKGFSGFLRRAIVAYGLFMIKIAVRPFVKVVFEDFPGRAADMKGCGAVYIFNHRSSSDPFIASLLKVELIQAVNGWPMRLPFFGFFAKRAEYIDTTAMDFDDMKKHVRNLAERGVSLVAFPEGTRSGSRTAGQFKSGVFKVALELGLKIYPCCITGNENLPDRDFIFSTGTINVKCLAPLTAEETMEFANAYLLKNRVREIIVNAACAAEERSAK